jgi:hypothetical protein
MRMEKGYVVVKTVSILGFPFRTYLRNPKERLLSSETWDEIHDAMIFDSFWKAVWQAVRHLAWVEEVEIWEG